MTPTTTASKDANQFALKQREATPKDIVSLLRSDDVKKQVELALPRHMKADRMLRVMITTLNSNAKLKACTQASLLSCLMKCSQYGLEPDGRHAHLIPFKEECTLIFDYKGLVNLVRRSGEVKTIHADVVYEGDEFQYHYGSGAHLHHKPTLDTSKRGDILAAYSFVVSATGEESFEVMPLGEILDIRDNSQGYRAFKNGYVKQSTWESSFPEMAKKTAFRRHTKWLPLSFELQEAVNADDDKQDDERRFANAKAVRATDLGSTADEPPASLPEPSVTQPAVEKSSEQKPRGRKPAEKSSEPAQTQAANSDQGDDNVPMDYPEGAKPALAPREALSAMLTASGFSEATLLETCVRRMKGPMVKSISEFPDDYIALLIQEWTLVTGYMRTDRAIS